MKKQLFLTFCLLSSTIIEASESAPTSKKRKSYNQKSTHALKQSVKKRTGNCQKAKPLLLAGADPNFMTDGNRPFLHEAVSHQAADVVEIALAKGANPNALSDIQENGLHYQNSSAEIITLLCDSGANVNQQNKWGYTPLHKHIVSKYRDVQRKTFILLLAGADHTIVDSCGRTPEKILITEGGNFLSVDERIERASWFTDMITFAPVIKKTIDDHETTLNTDLTTHLPPPLATLIKSYLLRPDCMDFFHQEMERQKAEQALLVSVSK